MADVESCATRSPIRSGAQSSTRSSRGPASAWPGRLACSILDEGLHFEIEVEVPGWTERVAVPSPARPGAVRGAVEKLLRDLGLTTV